jgi:hypothetical protein
MTDLRRRLRCHQAQWREAQGDLWRSSERLGVFKPGAFDTLDAGDLCTTWLEHLLLLSILQKVSGRSSWGRYVLVHPAGNADLAEI